MLLATLLLAVSQTPPTTATSDCAIVMTRNTSTAAAQVCLAEAELVEARAGRPGSPQWVQHLETAATLYKRALALTADDVVTSTVIERLLVIFDSAMLNEPSEMDAAYRQLIALRPSDAEPLLRYASYQERQGLLDAAEETLLSARRVQPSEVEPYRRLAQFYARRASALHSSATPEEVRDQTPPGAPDKNGVYQIGGTLTAPRRVGNAVYPANASVAGIEGSVVAEIVVNESGVVSEARVLKSIPLLDEAALQAVKEWRYDSTLVDGKPVPVRMQVTVNFSLGR